MPKPHSRNGVVDTFQIRTVFKAKGHCQKCRKNLIQSPTLNDHSILFKWYCTAINSKSVPYVVEYLCKEYVNIDRHKMMFWCIHTYMTIFLKIPHFQMCQKRPCHRRKKSFHSKATCQYGNTFMSYVLLVVGMSKSTVGENSGRRSSQASPHWEIWTIFFSIYFLPKIKKWVR